MGINIYSSMNQLQRTGICGHEDWNNYKGSRLRQTQCTNAQHTRCRHKARQWNPNTSSSAQCRPQNATKQTKISKRSNSMNCDMQQCIRTQLQVQSQVICIRMLTEEDCNACYNNKDHQSAEQLQSAVELQRCTVKSNLKFLIFFLLLKITNWSKVLNLYTWITKLTSLNFNNDLSFPFLNLITRAISVSI